MTEPQLIIRDDLIPEPVIDAALASALPPDSRHWKRGSESAGPNRVGRDGPTFLRLPEAHPSIDFMVGVIRGMVIPNRIDPRADLSYAGVFQMLPGAELSPHRDHNTTRDRHFRRRAAIILFLNDPDGGDFQIWDATGPIISVSPVRGRMLLVDANAYHGVTRVADDSRRLTLALHLCSRVTANDTLPHRNMTWLADDHPEAFHP